jgi:hypothetical protein
MSERTLADAWHVMSAELMSKDKEALADSRLTRQSGMQVVSFAVARQRPSLHRPVRVLVDNGATATRTVCRQASLESAVVAFRMSDDAPAAHSRRRINLTLYDVAVARSVRTDARTVRPSRARHRPPFCRARGRVEGKG